MVDRINKINKKKEILKVLSEGKGGGGYCAIALTIFSMQRAII